MSFTVSDIKDIDTLEKFYSFLMSTKADNDDDEEVDIFFDNYFVPDIDYLDFFDYLLENGYLCDLIHQSIITNMEIYRMNHKGNLEDEAYYLIALGIEAKYICNNELDKDYLLLGTEEAVKDVEAYWYLLLEYIFNNRSKNQQLQTAFKELYTDIFAFFETPEIEVSYCECPTDFDFLKRGYNKAILSELEDVLIDCLGVNTDDTVEDLLKNALKLLQG